MEIFVFSDESGVFDKKHNDYFVFAGIIILSSEQLSDTIHKFSHIENLIRKIEKLDSKTEIKASSVSNKSKGKVIRSLNDCYKFACIIDEKMVIDPIWNNKKDKQRYLDFAYKIGVKRAFEKMIINGIINPEDVNKIHFDIDEHSTATSGKYELEQTLEQEFKNGTYSHNYLNYYPPLFKNLLNCKVKFSDSAAPNKKMIRAADFIANKVYYLVNNNKLEQLNNMRNIYITNQPIEER